jgi:hypothetical protein
MYLNKPTHTCERILFGEFVLVARMKEEVHILDGTTNTSNHKQRI